MSVYWLQPWAWWGLAAVALPILVHLLARHRVREMPFPSLRFLRPTALAALRRRVLSDVPLLLVRVAMIAAAAAALAAPALVSSSRQRAWTARTSRAVIHLRRAAAVPDAPDTAAIVESERSSAFTNTVIGANGRVTDSLVDARFWLSTQPPSSREIVIVGDLRAGAVTSADIARVPPWIGVRFLPTPDPVAPGALTLSSVVDVGDGASTRAVVATATDEATRIVFQSDRGRVPSLVTVRAAADDLAAATAARDAVFAEGVRLPRGGERLLEIEFEGTPAAPVPAAPPGWMRRTLGKLADLSGGAREGRLVVRAPVRGSDTAAVHVIARVVQTAWSDPLEDAETRRIAPATLAAWSRPPAGLPADVTPGNEGDARWLWLMVLALLGIEWWMRRSRGAAVAHMTPTVENEARVA
jgi:hypothetical protein